MNAYTVAQHLTAADIRNAEAIVDTDGTTWCQVSPGFGFRRLGGHWHFGTIGRPESLMAVTVPATRTTLDRWAQRHTDLTPPHGLARRLMVVAR